MAMESMELTQGPPVSTEMAERSLIQMTSASHTATLKKVYWPCISLYVVADLHTLCIFLQNLLTGNPSDSHS